MSEHQAVRLSEIAKLELKPGEILVVTAPEDMSSLEHCAELEEWLDNFLNRELCKGWPVLVVPFGMKLETLSRPPRRYPYPIGASPSA